MLKVIKHGKGKRKREPLYHFTCDECGCEWVADNVSVSAHAGGMGYIWIKSNCPDCGTIASVETSFRYYGGADNGFD